MAKSSALASGPLRPLTASEHQLQKHWGLLQARLTGVLPNARISADITYGAFAVLQSGDYRLSGVRAVRLKRPPIPVVPLLGSVLVGPSLWISWTEEWREVRATNPRIFQYAHTNLTVYWGPADVDNKLQLFRIEWAGVEWTEGRSAAFPGAWAGHPHWQFDFHLGQLHYHAERARRLEELARELEGDVEEFDPSIMGRVDDDTPGAGLLNWLTRFHFASGANWAEQSWDGDKSETSQHAHNPESLSQIANWVVSSLNYIKAESGRL